MKKNHNNKQQQPPTELKIPGRSKMLKIILIKEYIVDLTQSGILPERSRDDVSNNLRTPLEGKRETIELAPSLATIS